MDTSEAKHYIAKNPTQQPKFLQKYPSYDGRGILIAIIDSCIDVSLPGLQKTTNGLPKIIDCFDLTGNGDVDTSTIKEANVDNILIGLTNRRLKIPTTWKNPSGKWHLGIKSIYELCDEDCLESIIEFRKEKICAQNKSLKKNYKSKTKLDEKFMQKYLKSTVKLAKDSLVADCIVWYDGEKWQACIDTSFYGNLEVAKVLTNFRDCHEYGIILDRLTYCVTIHNDGKLLEIFATFIKHGTLIANIAAGHYPDEPEKNGLAPGAQIVSFAVIDPRAGVKGNPEATVKAFKKCLEMKVDIINYSLGGFSEEIYSLMTEMVEKNGIIFVKGAGNDGPIYSSLYDLHPCYQNLIFQVGSCLTADMVKALNDIDVYHLPISSYFSSRGPMENGSCGISFLAPGHGIADVPIYIPKEERYFEATSYCTPNALGAIACLLSGIKAKKIEISFCKLKLALINTSYIPDGSDKISFGNGIIQIYDAFEFYLKNLKNFPLTIKNIVDESVDKLGVIIREEGKVKAVYTKVIKINVKNTSKKSHKISWNLKVSSECENFVTVVLQYDFLNIKINTKPLNPNSVNYAEIHGYDSLNPSWGPLFKFPITVFMPKTITENDTIREDVVLNSITPYRNFLLPPEESEQCFIKLTMLEEKNVTVFIQGHEGFDRVENSKYLDFTNAKKSHTWSFHLYEDSNVLEICMIQDIKFFECTKFHLEIRFNGLIRYYPSTFAWLMSFIPFLSPENLVFKNHMDQMKDVSISMKFDKILFKIFSMGAECKIENGTKLLKLTYYLKVPKTTTYYFMTEACDFKWFQEYTLKRFQIFTLSKKFIIGFAELWDGKVTLEIGTYEIIGLYEFYGVNLLAVKSPFNFELYQITVAMDLKKKPIKPKLYLKESFFKKSEILSKITFNENQKLRFYYYTSVQSDLRLLLPWQSCLKGSLKLFIDGTVMKCEEEQYHYQIWENIKTVVISVTDNIQWYLSWIAPDVTKNITQNEIIKLQKTIQNLYLTDDCEKLTNAIDEFLKATNYRMFFQHINELKFTENSFTKNSIKLFKSAIIDALFVKADMTLDEQLNHFSNIPSIFKNKFGCDLILNAFNATKTFEPSIFQVYWSIITFNLNMRSNYFIQSQQNLSHVINNNVFQNDAISNDAQQKFSSKICYNNKKKPKNNDKKIKEICEEFLQWIDDSDIRKYLILIKQALIFGEFGKALFYLNIVSTENQTFPEFKIFDEAIIELLKQFGWKHLVEAHENALLDRHRNYYRPF